jgi:hypothetical protein
MTQETEAKFTLTAQDFNRAAWPLLDLCHERKLILVLEF